MFRDLLTKEEKLKFITDNGWEPYGERPGNETYTKGGRWCEGGMCWHYNLDKAYEYEMEEEYDRLTTMLRDAKKLLKGLDTEGSTKWKQQYEKWVNI